MLKKVPRPLIYDDSFICEICNKEIFHSSYGLQGIQATPLKNSKGSSAAKMYKNHFHTECLVGFWNKNH